MRGKVRASALRRTSRSRLSIVNSDDPLVSVIIPYMNEKHLIRRIVREARSVHPRTEVIIVANGSNRKALAAVRATGAKVLAFDERLGHDVGRSIGAQAAYGEVLLFIDADMVIPSGRLQPFVNAIASGDADVALNDYSGPTGKKEVHSVVLAKHALNAMLGEDNLKGASLTAIPHAINRKTLVAVGPQALLVPPLAQAKAIQLGLKVKAVHTIQVGRMNPIRRTREKKFSLASVIVGDHLEALNWWTDATDERGGMEDYNRKRHFLGG
ncbi:glycosyltransferase family 2 protein [Paenibacillus sp. MAHUQ-46]|uniref:4,4'-diaponeurosporenoate glycosyltransferase n=2 Tax=Paenibacillus TaxID=44249 RepID=A0A934J6K2_9BACL|nr:glycosyltransferase family 2 protein [Paenibacillus roseus]